MKTYAHLWWHLAEFFSEGEIVQISCIENKNMHFLSNIFFSPENRAVYKITWKNMVKPDRSQNTIWHGRQMMRFACPTNRPLLRHNWLIPSHLVKKVFTATFTYTEKLRNDLTAITTYFSHIVRLEKTMSKIT